MYEPNTSTVTRQMACDGFVDTHHTAEAVMRSLWLRNGSVGESPTKALARITLAKHISILDTQHEKG